MKPFLSSERFPFRWEQGGNTSENIVASSRVESHQASPSKAPRRDVQEGLVSEHACAMEDVDGRTREEEAPTKPTCTWTHRLRWTGYEEYSKRLMQQKLQAWRPIMKPKPIFFFFLSFGAAWMALGVVCLVTNLDVHVEKIRYDDRCDFSGLDRHQAQELLWSNHGQGVPCEFNFTVEKEMDAPIYVFYEIDPFYQNYRRYVRSVDYNQLHGEDANGTSASICSPQEFLGGKKNESLPNDGLVNPCGLTAWSFFNDTFSLYETSDSVPLSIDENNIAWTSDVNDLFAEYDAVNFNTVPRYRGGGNLTVPVNQDQHFLVWMRVSARPRTRKLWGVVRQQLPQDTVLTLSVLNRFNTYQQGGEKYLILTTQSWLGGENYVLPAVFMVVGGTFILVAFAYIIVLAWKGYPKVPTWESLTWNQHLRRSRR